MSPVSFNGRRWLGAAWALLPVLVAAVVVVGRPSAAPSPASAAPVAAVPASPATAIVAATIAAPASRDEPLAVFGE